MGSRPRCAGALAALALVLTSCGPSPERQIDEVLARAQAAFAAQDAGELCDLLSRKARATIGSSAHESPPFRCRDDVARFFGWIHGYRGGARPRVESVSAAGDDALRAEVRLPDGRTVTIPFTREAERWRLDGLFDARLSQVQLVLDAQAKALAEPASTDRRISGTAAVTRADGRPCPPIDVSDFPTVRGGCRIRFATSTVDISVWTPFGVGVFGRCSLDVVIRADGRGDAWMTQFMISGLNPCSDAVPCRDRELAPVPWQAAIEKGDDGRVLHVSDACLDTCFGRVDGDWRVPLSGEREQRMTRFSEMFGTSGLQLTSQLDH